MVLAVTAIGTSIDALAVGVTLALVGANIVVNALAIGAATFTMATIGVMTGRFLGEKFGRYAEARGRRRPDRDRREDPGGHTAELSGCGSGCPAAR